MIERFETLGYIESSIETINDGWSGVCVTRKAMSLETETGLSLGVEITAPSDTRWLNQATLVLAACQEGWDCCLEYRNSQWVLWKYYSIHADDNDVIENLKLQLALAYYFEHELLQPIKKQKPRLWRGKL